LYSASLPIDAEKDRTMLAIRLPADLEQRLGALAERTGRTKTFYAREAIERHLDDLEDLYLAEKELEKVQSGRSKPVSLAEVMKAHGLER
jgi:RHH-type rel operon transcriptional repressor/antitoxin RelB